VVHTCTPAKGQPLSVCIADLGGAVPPEIPQNKPAGETVSVSQLQHKVPKKAAKTFQRALKFSQAGEHEKAVAELEAALRQDPQLASAENQLGAEYAYLERWEEAEQAFRRLTGIEPNSWKGHYNLALILYSKKDFPGAEQSARRALGLSSDTARIHLLLGELLILHDQTRTEGLTELRFAARTLSEARWVLRVLGTR
jgi:tetratricopeptide (TPR) repeat protein